MRSTVRKIPRGFVSTYGDVAKAAGFPGRARQVVWALKVNEPGLPWHRVIGSGGRIPLGGESGLEQRLRLRQEGIQLVGDRVDLKKYGHQFKTPRSRPKAVRSKQ